MNDLAIIETATSPKIMELATKIANSQLIPTALQRKPQDVLIVLLTGHELGLQPMQAIRSINVVQGKPVMAADLMVALCLKNREVCEYVRLVEESDKAVSYEAKRRGSEPVRMTYTMADAAQAGLAGKQNWKLHPKAMLRARCSSAIVRAVFPDLFMGCYDPDEAQSFQAPTERPAPVVVLNPKPEPKQEAEDAVVPEARYAGYADALDAYTGYAGAHDADEPVEASESELNRTDETLIRLGKAKGTHLCDADDKTLLWLLGVYRENVNDSAKARFKVSNGKFLMRIAEEMARRGLKE